MDRRIHMGVRLSGKFIGPLGLALIMGAGDLIKPAAPNLDEIDSRHDLPSPAVGAAARTAASR